MCDELTERDNQAYLKELELTRRDFGKLGMGAAIAAVLPAVASAENVLESEVEIETPDGVTDAYFVHPAKGRHPGVIVWPDVMGIRPSYRSMGKRLAQSGYAVLVVNPYYRTFKGRITPEGGTYGDPELRAKIQPHRESLSPETCVRDGKAFVGFLDSQDVVDTDRQLGTTGYCMTGSYTFRLAAAMPERIGAGASFHGGGLVTDAEDSPHKLIAQIKGGMLVAIAENDDSRQPEAKTVLAETFASAGVDGEVEVYQGALHGWCPPDSPVYNEVQAERAWGRLLVLFETHLAPSSHSARTSYS